MTHPIRCLCAALLPFAAATAQMEKRDQELYERDRFLRAEPAQGTVAPDLVLTALDGSLHALSSWRGRVVVVIKGGFT